jgi:hypothetical protein
MIRTNRSSRCIAVVLLLLTAIPVPVRAAAAATDGPESFLARFTDAWQGRDLAAYAALLTDDYRFHFGDAEGRAEHPDGWGKDDELASASHLFLGRADRPDRPRAQSIELVFDGVAILPDPEYPCDREHHALIDARRVRLAIILEGGGSLGAIGHHAYWIVRDAAGGAWRVRRWDEEPADELLVAAACPDTTGPIAGGADAESTQAGVAAVAMSNRLWTVAPDPSRVGANAVLTFAVERDGDAVDAALYDVAGRRVSVLARGPSAAGVRAIAWDGRDAHGAIARAGVYFLRVRAGERLWRERVVRTGGDVR